MKGEVEFLRTSEDTCTCNTTYQDMPPIHLTKQGTSSTSVLFQSYGLGCMNTSPYVIYGNISQTRSLLPPQCKLATCGHCPPLPSAPPPFQHQAPIPSIGSLEIELSIFLKKNRKFAKVNEPMFQASNGKQTASRDTDCAVERQTSKTERRRLMIMCEQQGWKRFLRETWAISKGGKQIRFWGVCIFSPSDLVDCQLQGSFSLYSPLTRW